MDVAFCAAGSNIKAPLFNSQSPVVRLNGRQRNWKSLSYGPVYSTLRFLFQKRPVTLNKEPEVLCSDVSARLNVHPRARAHGLKTLVIENTCSRLCAKQHIDAAKSKSTTDSCLCGTVAVQQLTELWPRLPRYLCFHLHSAVPIKDCALNFMIACVSYS